MYVIMQPSEKLQLSRVIAIEEKEYVTGHYTCLLNIAESHRQLGHYNDVIVRVGDRDFKANKMVLGSFSAYFHNKFTGQNSDEYEHVITVSDVRADVVGQLIDFIYTEKIVISRDNVCDILEASEVLEIEDAKAHCIKFLSEALTPGNFQLIRSIGERHNFPHLVKEANDVIRRHTVDIIRGEDFNRSGSDELKVFIKNRDKTKINEEEMYSKLIGWVRHDPDDRRVILPELMIFIDMERLSSVFLNEVVYHEPLMRESEELKETLLKVLNDRLVHSRSNSVSPPAAVYEGAVGVQGKLLLIGSDRISNDVRELNLATKQLKDFVPNITPRYDSAATILNNRLFLAGGQVRAGVNVTSSIECLNLCEDAPRQWTNLRPMQQRRFCFGMTAINDKVIVVGGADEKSAFLSSCEALDTTRDQWMRAAEMIERRTAHAVVSCQGCVFVLGGHNRVRPLELVESFDPRTGRWRSIAPMTSRRRWLSAAVVRDEIFAIGGDSEGYKRTPLETVEKYDHSANKWMPVASMNNKRRGARACALEEKIYVVGGADTDKTHSTIEVYDVTHEEWIVDFETNEQFLYSPIAAYL